MSQFLREVVTPKIGNIILEAKDEMDHLGRSGKHWYLQGICIQGGIKNANGRVYPVSEITRAVKSMNDMLENDYSIVGALDHPDDLNIALDRASHAVMSMWMDGPNGYGKLKILSTPMGNIAKALIEDGVKVGVSSRGSGNVKNDGTGEVSDFEIVTIDLVATPSAPGSYPTPIYEHLMNSRGGYSTIQLAHEIKHDPKAQKHLATSLINIIRGLK